MKTICTGMFTIMLIFLFRPVGAKTEDAFPSYIEQCFNNYFNFTPQEKIYMIIRIMSVNLFNIIRMF